MTQATTTTILPSWFQSDLGQALMNAEQTQFRNMIPDLYYQVAVQAGGCQWPILDTLNVGIPIIIDQQEHNKDCPVLLAETQALPFAEHSIDLVVMPHGLDFCNDPVRTLREVSQVLVPGGHLALTGFNHNSLFGCCRLINQWFPGAKNHAPWNGRFYRVREIQEWLSLLGLELVAGTMMFYQFPVQNNAWRKRFVWMGSVGDRWWPSLGGVYLLVLKKQMYSTIAKANQGNKIRHWLGGFQTSPANQKTHHTKTKT